MVKVLPVPQTLQSSARHAREIAWCAMNGDRRVSHRRNISGLSANRTVIKHQKFYEYAKCINIRMFEIHHGTSALLWVSMRLTSSAVLLTVFSIESWSL